MRYSLSAAILAFASIVSAANPTADFDPISVPSAAIDTVAAGSTYTIKWTSTEKYNGTVTLKLLEGATQATLTLASDPIDTEIDNEDIEYDCEIPVDIEVFATYGIQISWDSNPEIFQWSFPFHITGSTAGDDDTPSPSTTAPAGSSPTSTKTVQVTPNSSYTSTPVSSSTKVSSAATVVSSAVTAPTTVVTVPSSTSTATSTVPVVVSNGTLSTSGSLTPTVSGTSTRTSAPIATVSANAAMANMVKGSFAVFGGAILALVL